jgi:hypothetical protein
LAVEIGQGGIMANIRTLWRDDGSAIDRGRALTTSLLVLALTAAAIGYIDARDEVYERLSHKRLFATLWPIASDTTLRQL